MEEFQIRGRYSFLGILHLDEIGRKVWGEMSGKTEGNWDVIAGVRWWWTRGRNSNEEGEQWKGWSYLGG